MLYLYALHLHIHSKPYLRIETSRPLTAIRFLKSCILWMSEIPIILSRVETFILEVSLFFEGYIRRQSNVFPNCKKTQTSRMSVHSCFQQRMKLPLVIRWSPSSNGAVIGPGYDALKWVMFILANSSCWSFQPNIGISLHCSNSTLSRCPSARLYEPDTTLEKTSFDEYGW